MQSRDLEIALRVLNTLRQDEVVRQKDALQLRMQAPLEKRMRPLRELADEVVRKYSQAAAAVPLPAIDYAAAATEQEPNKTLKHVRNLAPREMQANPAARTRRAASA